MYLARAYDVTIDSSTTLSGSFASGNVQRIDAACKNITITPPESAWEKQDFQGEDSNGFQNQLLDEKPVGMATFTGTLILGEDETIADYMVSGTVASKPSGYTRYQIGANNKNELAVCVTLNDQGNYTSQATFVLDNARATKWGDVRVAGPDGHWEQDVTLICLAKDFYYEFKN